MNLDARLREQLAEATYKHVLDDKSEVIRQVDPSLIVIKIDSDGAALIKGFEPRTPRAMIDAAKAQFKKFDPNRMSAVEKVEIARAELAASDYRVLKAMEMNPSRPENNMERRWVVYRDLLRKVIRAEGRGVELPVKPE